MVDNIRTTLLMNYALHAETYNSSYFGTPCNFRLLLTPGTCAKGYIVVGLCGYTCLVETSCGFQCIWIESYREKYLSKCLMETGRTGE